MSIWLLDLIARKDIREGAKYNFSGIELFISPIEEKSEIGDFY